MTTQMLQEDLPYEKFIRLGAEALTDAELLAILLRTGSRSHTALELAKDVLRMAGGQKGCLNVYYPEEAAEHFLFPDASAFPYNNLQWSTVCQTAVRLLPAWKPCGWTFQQHISV